MTLKFLRLNRLSSSFTNHQNRQHFLQYLAQIQDVLWVTHLLIRAARLATTAYTISAMGMGVGLRDIMYQIC